MRVRVRAGIFIACFLLFSARAVYGGTITVSLADFNGTMHSWNSTFPVPAVTVGTFHFSVPAGHILVGGTLSGTWGTHEFAYSSAGVDLYLNGLFVGQCVPLASFCWANTSTAFRPWSFTLSAAQLATLQQGSGVLAAVQTNPYVVRLGGPTLTVQTALATPEPSSLALLGSGLAGLAGLVRLRRRVVRRD